MRILAVCFMIGEDFGHIQSSISWRFKFSSRYIFKAVNVNEIKIGSAGIETLRLDSTVLNSFRHHRFQGLEVMPGAAFISAVVGVFQSNGLQVHRLSTITFQSILLLTVREGESLALEIHVSRESEHDFVACCQTRDKDNAIIEHARM